LNSVVKFLVHGNLLGVCFKLRGRVLLVATTCLVCLAPPTDSARPPVTVDNPHSMTLQGRS